MRCISGLNGVGNFLCRIMRLRRPAFQRAVKRAGDVSVHQSIMKTIKLGRATAQLKYLHRHAGQACLTDHIDGIGGDDNLLGQPQHGVIGVIARIIPEEIAAIGQSRAQLYGISIG